MALAQITLIGNVGRDPEMNYTPTGVAVTKFSVAVNRKLAGKDVTNWYNCVAWQKLAEMLNEHLRKGQQVFVQGDFAPREYTSRDGQQRSSLDVTVSVFQFIGGKREAGAGGDPGDLPADEAPF